MNKLFAVKSSVLSVIMLTIFQHILLLSCSSSDETALDIVNATEFELTQPKIKEVKNTGISLEFNFNGCSEYLVEEYGLIWYNKEDTLLLNNFVHTVSGKPSNNITTFEINSCLPVNKTVYFRAYIKVQGRIKYSQFVSVISKGCNAPVIDKLFPDIPLAFKQIKIAGSNFAKTNNPDYLKISVNNYMINPDSVTSDGIYFTLPAKYFESHLFSYEMVFKIIIFGSEYPIDNKWTLSNPWRNIPLTANFPLNSKFNRGSATTFDYKGYFIFAGQNNSIYTYNVSANTWSVLSMPLNVDENSFCFYDNNKIFVLTQGVLYSRDINDSNWKQVASYPTKYPSNNKPFICFIDKWLYIGFFEFHVETVGSENIREFKRYSIVDDKWEQLTPIPDDGGQIYSFFIYSYGNKINVGTRRTNVAWDYSTNRRIWSYSINNNVWSWDFEGQYGDYPTHNNNYELELSSFRDEENIFIGFGKNQDWPTYCANYAWKFNAVNSTWSMIPKCPSHMRLVAWFSIGKKIYLLGTDENSSQKFFYELDTNKF